MVVTCTVHLRTSRIDDSLQLLRTFDCSIAAAYAAKYSIDPATSQFPNCLLPIYLFFVVKDVVICAIFAFKRRILNLGQCLCRFAPHRDLECMVLKFLYIVVVAIASHKIIICPTSCRQCQTIASIVSSCWTSLSVFVRSKFA